MTNKESFSEKLIIDCLNTDYGINLTMLTLLPLGADMDASVYKAQAHDQSSYFVKLKRGHFDDIGVTVQLSLYNAGIQQVIPPIKTKAGKATQHIDGFTLIVYPFIQGQDGFSHTLTSDQWITLGKALKQVHEFYLPPSVRALVKRECYSPQWREAVRAIYSRIESEANSETTSDVIALKFITCMKEHRAIIQRLVDRAEQLSKKIQAESPQFVLCHSDIHGGNVLINENGTIYIVDWDAPIMAPKERDLMFIGGGVANIWNNPLEEEFFYKGYGKTDINMAIMAYYRHERIVEDIAVYSQELLSPIIDDKSRSEMYKQFIDMFEPRGVVDIAFKTDKEFVLYDEAR